MSDMLPTTEVITELRDSGLTWAEISARVGVPIVVAQQDTRRPAVAQIRHPAVARRVGAVCEVSVGRGIR